MHVCCDYDTYIYSIPDVPKYPFSKSGVPVPVPKFPGNLASHQSSQCSVNRLTCVAEIKLKIDVFALHCMIHLAS